MKHTKGEWKVDWATIGNLPYNYKLHEYPYQETEEEAEANARLIASAPDLLEACEELLKNFHNMLGDVVNTACDDCGLDIKEDVLKLEQAINKAKGK